MLIFAQMWTASVVCLNTGWQKGQANCRWACEFFQESKNRQTPSLFTSQVYNQALTTRSICTPSTATPGAPLWSLMPPPVNTFSTEKMPLSSGGNVGSNWEAVSVLPRPASHLDSLQASQIFICLEGLGESVEALPLVIRFLRFNSGFF